MGIENWYVPCRQSHQNRLEDISSGRVLVPLGLENGQKLGLWRETRIGLRQEFGDCFGLLSSQLGAAASMQHLAQQKQITHTGERENGELGGIV